MALSLVEAMQNYSSVANANDTIAQSRANTSLLQDKAKLSRLAINQVEQQQGQETNFQGKLSAYAGAHADTNLATTEGALSAYSKLAEQTTNPKELEYLRSKQTALLTQQATDVAAKAKVEEDQSTILVDQVSRALSNRTPEDWQKSIDLAPDNKIKQGLQRAAQMHMSPEYGNLSTEQKQVWDDRMMAQLAPMKEGLKAQYQMANMAYKEKALAEKEAKDKEDQRLKEQQIAAQRERNQAALNAVKVKVGNTNKELILENKNFSVEQGKLKLKLYGDNTDKHPGLEPEIPNPESHFYNSAPEKIPNPAYQEALNDLSTLNARHAEVVSKLGGKIQEDLGSPKETISPKEDLKTIVESHGQQYEPDKYDYRVVDGEVQRKAK